MYSYVFTVEEPLTREDVRKIEEALPDLSLKVSMKKREILIDTDGRIEEIYEILKNAGYTVTDIEMA